MQNPKTKNDDSLLDKQAKNGALIAQTEKDKNIANTKENLFHKRESHDKKDGQNRRSEKQRLMDSAEEVFEKKCYGVIAKKDWIKLEVVAVD